MKPLQTAQLPCQNCGRPVTVILPFIGCVFCNDCLLHNSSDDARAREFKREWITADNKTEAEK